MSFFLYIHICHQLSAPAELKPPTAQPLSGSDPVICRLLLLSLHLVPTCFFLFILTYFYSDNYVFCRNYKLLASYFIIPSNVFFASRQRGKYLFHFYLFSIKSVKKCYKIFSCILYFWFFLLNWYVFPGIPFA